MALAFQELQDFRKILCAIVSLIVGINMNEILQISGVCIYVTGRLRFS